MGRGDRHKDASKDLSNVGTSARTRPMSIEDIMLRRKKKLEGASKGTATEVKESLDKNSYRGISEFSLHHEGGKKLKTLKDEVKDRSGKAEGNISKGAKDKSERKEKDLYEKFKSYKGSRDKESFKEKKTYRRKVDYQLGTDFKNETDKKYLKVANERNKHEERDHKSRMAGKRKYHSHADEKVRSKDDGAIMKKLDSGKSREKQYPERLDRKTGHSRAYHEQVRSRRRSRSQDLDHEKDRRSFSLSPRSQKHYHHARDYEERSQSYRDKVRKKHSDSNKHRSTGNGYADEHNVELESGLGGYSPRKKKTEHALETPSPASRRSPERKIATWDQPPGKTTANFDCVLTEYHQLPSAKMDDLPPPVLLTDATIKLQPTPIDIASVVMKASIDSVQLTEATRRMRRLYVENLPTSALDRTVIDCLNDFLLSSGVNHIQGTKPCISCIMNKDKCQALVEFLTPEDATAALSFDGRFFSGSVLKIRRPKDFVETPTGALEKLVDEFKGISDDVQDSPHKIFIAGISEAISSDMLMKIVSAFGVLKAYHFEFNEELDGSCAFLEYMDHSITSKACAGLNGMKLGGCFLTAVPAVLETDVVEEEKEGAPSYKIPFHVKPLLIDATQVLRLKNMFTEEEFLSFSELELDEMLEDTRLECARFGTIKSMNMVTYKGVAKASLQDHDPIPTEEEIIEEAHVEVPSSGSTELQGGRESSQGVNDLGSLKDLDNYGNSIESFEMKVSISNKLNEEEIPIAYNVVHQPSDPQADSGKFEGRRQGAYDMDDNGVVSSISKMEVDDKIDNIGSSTINCGVDSGEGNGERKPMIDDANLGIIVENTHGYVGEQSCGIDVFQPGCIFVEYTRKEAACIAAHSLHGRFYGDRVVIARYVQLDAYLRRFPR